MPSRIKLIIFDAGGVLYEEIDEDLLTKTVLDFLRRHGVDKSLDEIEKSWERYEKLGKVGKMKYEDVKKMWLKEMGLLKFSKEWDKEEIGLWLATKMKKGVNRVLKKLRENYKLAVLSDSIMSCEEKRYVMELVGIDTSLFDKIFTSNDIGYEKPHPKSYETVLHHFSVKPEEAVFVGHDKEELDGASRVGLTVVDVSESTLEEKLRFLLLNKSSDAN